MTQIYIIKYSTNKRDNTFDSEIIECYLNKNFALLELEKIRKKNESDGYTYYIDSHYLNDGLLNISEGEQEE